MGSLVLLSAHADLMRDFPFLSCIMRAPPWTLLRISNDASKCKSVPVCPWVHVRVHRVATRGAGYTFCSKGARWPRDLHARRAWSRVAEAGEFELSISSHGIGHAGAPSGTICHVQVYGYHRLVRTVRMLSVSAKICGEELAISLSTHVHAGAPSRTPRSSCRRILSCYVFGTHAHSCMKGQGPFSAIAFICLSAGRV